MGNVKKRYPRGGRPARIIASRAISAQDGKTERCFGVRGLGHAPQIIISYPNEGLGVSSPVDLSHFSHFDQDTNEFPKSQSVSRSDFLYALDKVLEKHTPDTSCRLTPEACNNVVTHNRIAHSCRLYRVSLNLHLYPLD